MFTKKINDNNNFGTEEVRVKKKNANKRNILWSIRQKTTFSQVWMLCVCVPRTPRSRAEQPTREGYAA